MQLLADSSFILLGTAALVVKLLPELLENIIETVARWSRRRWA
jgi:hypothetical protein